MRAPPARALRPSTPGMRRPRPWAPGARSSRRGPRASPSRRRCCCPPDPWTARCWSTQRARSPAPRRAARAPPATRARPRSAARTPSCRRASSTRTTTRTTTSSRRWCGDDPLPAPRRVAHRRRRDAAPAERDLPDDVKTNASIELRFLMSGVTSVVGSGGIGGWSATWRSTRTPTPSSRGAHAASRSPSTRFPSATERHHPHSGCAYPSVVTKHRRLRRGGSSRRTSPRASTRAPRTRSSARPARLGLVTAQTTVLHAVGTNAKDVAAIQAAGAKVVWAPRSNICLYGNTMPITEMKAPGVPISLGPTGCRRAR